MHDGQICLPYAGRQGCGSRTSRAPYIRRPLPRGRRRRCTSRRASARRSCRSASSRGRRRRSCPSNRGLIGRRHAQRSARRRARAATRPTRRARSRASRGLRREPAAAARRASAIERRGRHVAVELHLALEWGASIPAVGARGAARASPTTSSGWPDARPARGRRRRRRDRPRPRHDLARRRADRRDARDGAVRLPRLRLVAVARAAARSTRTAGSRRPRTEWGAWGTLYYDDDGRLLGSMQYGPGGALPARGRAAGRARRRTTRCSSPARTSSTARRPWVHAVALPRRDRRRAGQGRGALEAFAYRYPEGESDVRALPRPPDGLPARLPRRLRLPTVRARAGSSSRGSSSAGSSRCSRAGARGCCGALKEAFAAASRCRSGRGSPSAAGTPSPRRLGSAVGRRHEQPDRAADRELERRQERLVGRVDDGHRDVAVGMESDGIARSVSATPRGAGRRPDGRRR